MNTTITERANRVMTAANEEGDQTVIPFATIHNRIIAGTISETAALSALEQYEAKYGIEPAAPLSIDATELTLWADNTSSLYGMRLNIVENLSRKITKGIYDPEKAVKLWRYWFDAAARDYRKEFGCSTNVFPPAVRDEAARAFSVIEFERIKDGEYN